MSGTNVPALTFGPAGILVPSEPAVLAGVQADLALAFGSDINLALETPGGQIASSETAIIGDKDAQILYLASQFDPATAQGRFQDALGNIYFQTRQPAVATVVQAVCAGATGVVIPTTAIATAVDGNTYFPTTAGTISSTGSVTILFACSVTGPIACPATTLNQITTTTPGWDSISNPADGIVGSNVETRAAFEARRALSVENNAVNSNGAILGALFGVTGLLDAYVIDNPTNSSATLGGVSVAANSLYIVAYGGAGADVANAIFTKKPPGTPMSGNTTLTVQDTNPLYNGAGPSYPMIWETPTPLPINAAVSIPNTTSVPSNAQALVTAAYQAAFAGTDGLPKASKIGFTTYASRFYPGIAALGGWATNIISLFVGTGSTPTSNSVTSTIAQIPTAGTITLTLV